jgi:nicotinate-nucleotide adenylyltransferase
MGLDSIVYVPAARSPHKADAPTPPHHRVRMLELAIESIPNAFIWTGELDRAAEAPESPSYWCETWVTIRESRAGAPDRFLIGADQALSMHRWYRFEQFWRDAIVVLRDEQDDPDSLIDALQALGAWTSDDLEHWRSQIVQVPMIDASSTSIRSSLAAPERRENPIAGLDDRVQKYILDNGLYLP